MKRVDAIIRWVSYVLVPVGALLLTLFFYSQQEDPHDSREPLRIATLADAGAALSPEAARARLRDAPLVRSRRTELSEAPFWFWIPLAEPLPEAPVLILPSRHARSIACWDGASLERLGAADRSDSEGAMKQADTGFALLLPTPATEALLCRGLYLGPARITAELWPAAAQALADREWARDAGMLEGALLALVLLTVAFSVLNRDAAYLLLGMWLLANMRLAAISIGWDDTWMGMRVPADWLAPMRQLTIAVYYLLTFALFERLFRGIRQAAVLRWLLAATRGAGVVLLAAAILLPFGAFLPLMWGIVAAGIFAMIVCLMAIVLRERARGAMLYGGALVMVLAGSASEIVAAAFDFDLLIGVLNNVTSALASSALAVLAFMEQLRSERQRREQAQRELARTYQNTPVGLFTLDDEHRIRRSNAALRRMLDFSTADASPRWEDCFAPGAGEALQRALEAEDDGEVEIPGRESGGTRWYQLRAVRSEQGVEGFLQDVSERVAATEELRYLAEHDSVTGARNRRGLEGALNAALADTGAAQPGALAYLNLDRFKLVNELHGYATGDDLLRRLSERMQLLLPPEAVLARLSGDSFLLLFPGAPLATAMRLCRKIQTAITQEPLIAGRRSFPLGAAVGLLELTPDIKGIDAISAAERACREAKQGPRLVAYDRNAQALAERVEELRVIKSMDRSEAPAGLRLAMQPILSLQDPAGSMNFEVLLRMEDAEGHPVPVGRALAAAETSGNMSKLDLWVLRRTLEWLRAHRAQLPNTRFVCVNLSGSSLNDEQFISEVLVLLAGFEDVAPLLCLEITEAVALRDLAVSRHFMERLRDRGVRMALDDFGAGFTSFNYLRQLEAEVLKIDGSLVRNMAAHPRDTAIIAAIVGLAGNMGMRTIAEWAEDVPTLEALVDCGADYVQGWVISAAQKPEAILQAQSSADFAQDEAVRAFLQRLMTTR